MGPTVPTKNRTRADIEAENQYLRRGGIAEQMGQVAQTAIRFAALVICFYYIKESVVALSGHETTASINFLSKVEVSNAVAWIFGGGGIAYGYKQKKLKGETVERLQDRITKMEKSIDPNRSTSKLTAKGETNPKDRS